MLRTDIPSIADPRKAPAVEKEEKDDFTVDHIKTLFTVVAQGSHDTSSSARRSCELARIKMYEYFLSVLNDDPAIKRLQSRQRDYVIDQINIVIKKNVFVGKLALPVIEKIKDDIKNNGEKLKAKVPESDWRELLEDLTRIRNDAQAAVPVSNVNVFIGKPSTGINKAERNSIKWGLDFSGLRTAIGSNAQGLEELRQQHWITATHYFSQAIFEEQERAAESKEEVNKEHMRVYHFNLAHAFNFSGIEMQEKQQYEKAIEYYKQAIFSLELSPINPDNQILKKHMLTFFYRNLSNAYNWLAIKLFHSKDIDGAIFHHRLSIEQLDKIAVADLSDNDHEGYSVYYRNFAFVLNEKGQALFYQNQFAKAAECYSEALQAIQKIQPERMVEGDVDMLFKFDRNFNIALSRRDGRTPQYNRNRIFKRRFEELALAPGEEPAKKARVDEGAPRPSM